MTPSVAQAYRIYSSRHAVYEAVGSDTFILATPVKNVLSTCDPAVIHQVFTRAKDFPPDLAPIKVLEVYGRSLVSTKGDEWKVHRRLVNNGLSTDAQVLAWEEGSFQAEGLVQHWLETGASVQNLRRFTSTLVLHVLSRSFYGKRRYWAAEEEVPPNHTMSFSGAKRTLLESLKLIAILPRPLLTRLPFASTKAAAESYFEWSAYMKEMRQDILDHADERMKKPKKTLLEHLVLARLDHEDVQNLHEDYALSNIFLVMLAGLETTGSTLAFTMMLLAIYPEWQKRIQSHLDDYFGDRPREEWNMQQDYEALRESVLWAAMHESMRVYGVVQHLFRETETSVSVQDSAGVQHTIPPQTACMLNFAACHHNPANWAPEDGTAERRAELADSPALNFQPERFLANKQAGKSNPSGPTFFPFGQGWRQCPGERFAAVEMTAVFATIYKSYSVELEVPGETLAQCQGDAQKAWEVTRDEAIRTLWIEAKASIRAQMSGERHLKFKVTPRSQKA
ncbi:cytochrome P450 [Cadophora sp. DSE1049]|nr:cytochrome P450 [Cadophora sp. DSE1049]